MEEQEKLITHMSAAVYFFFALQLKSPMGNNIISKNTLAFFIYPARFMLKRAP